MTTLLEVVALVLLAAFVVACWFIFHGDPSLIELWHRAAMAAVGAKP